MSGVAVPLPGPVGMPSDDDLDAEEGPGFGWVGNDDAAEWAAARLAGEEAAIAEFEAQHRVWVDRYERWLADVTGPHRRRAERLRAELEGYGLMCRDTSDRRTVTLPSAVVRTTAHKARVGPSDPAEFLAWCGDPRLLNVKVSPALAEIARRFRAVDGDIVDVESGEVVADAPLAVTPASVSVSVSTVGGER